MSKFDVVILGAGHNGLVAAAYLAKHGLRIIVLERRGIVGGACVTEEIFPGFRFSTGAYAYGLFHEKIVRDLRLSKYGLKVRAKNPQYFLPFPDGSYLFTWRSLSRTLREIRRFSPEDVRGYERFDKFWANSTKILKCFILRPPPTHDEVANIFRNSGQEDAYRWVFTSSVAEFLDEFFVSDKLKGVLATQGVIGTMAGPRTPGTTYVMAHHLLGEVEGQSGAWGYVIGGMGGLTTALARSAESLGATILTNAEVKRILTRNGHVSGVELVNGKIIESRVVVSNADPKRTFNLVDCSPPKDVDLGGYKIPGSAMKVLCALKELPDYIAYPGKKVGDQHRGSVDICPSLDYLERAFEDAREGRPSKEPFLEYFIQSAVDRTVAPRGKHTLSVFAMYAPHSLRTGSWDRLREKIDDSIIQKLAEYAPNLEKNVIARLVLTRDLEERFGLTNGNIFHGEILPDQIFTSRPSSLMSRYSTPIGGLFSCGAGVHPGGGVFGAPGFNAAAAVISGSSLRSH